MSTIEAVAFDKDGVLFDSERIYQRSLTLALEQLNLTIDDAVKHSFIGGDLHTIRRVLQNILGERMNVATFLKEYWLAERDRIIEEEGLDFIDGVESLIESLYAQGYPLALVTNDSLDNLLADVSRSRRDLLSYFSVVITLDNVVNAKPHPEPYERASAFLGVAPEQLLVIEDSVTGARAAVAAGARVLLLNEHQTPVPEDLAANVHKIITHHREVCAQL